MRTFFLILFILLYLPFVVVACSSRDATRPSKLHPASQPADAEVEPADGEVERVDAEVEPLDSGSPRESEEAGIEGDETSSPESSAYIDSSNALPVNTHSNGQSGPDRSCCQPHAEAGCDDPAIEACVCAQEVLPGCCTGAWDAFCVEVVRQRFCEQGVRQCVCEQWEQSDCCAVQWTNNFCELTAELKCGATAGCERD